VIVLFIALVVLQFVFYASGILAILGVVLGCLEFFILPIAAVALWIILMVFAFQGKYFKLPIIGDYAEKFANPTA
jgi:uncharacterized membrane protein